MENSYCKWLSSLEVQDQFDYKEWFDLFCTITEEYHNIKYSFAREMERWCSSPFLDNANQTDPLCFGQCGNDVYWKIIDYVLYIGGTGDMWDFNMDGIEDDDSVGKIIAPWSFSNYSDVIIQNGVTSIGEYAFFDGPMDHIMIPSSVHTIKEGAFGATGPRLLEIPPTVQTIAPNIIFDDPCSIGTLIVSANIPNIAPSAFYSRYLAPKEIILTGTMPDDLSALVKSELFLWANAFPKITYPHTWDSGNESFFIKLSQEIKKQGELDDLFAENDDYFASLEATLIPSQQ